MSTSLGLPIKMIEKRNCDLRILEYKLIDIFSTPSSFKKLNSVGHKGFLRNKLNKIMNEDLCIVEPIYECSKFKRLETLKTGKESS